MEHCENLPFLQGQAVASLEESCLDGEPSVPSKSKSTPEAYLCEDKTTDTLTRFRSGMTYVPLTVARGEVVLMWFRGDSRARTSQQQEKGQELKAPDLAYGGRWRESSAKYDRDSSSWKTHRSLFPEVLDWFSLTLPKWGMMLDGVLWERMTQVLPTRENACGFSLPTLKARDWKDTGGNLPKSRTVKPGLDNTQQRIVRILKEKGLQWWMGEIEVPGPINPEWSAWLMGFPIGWTESKPLETHRFQRWLHLHGKS